MTNAASVDRFANSTKQMSGLAPTSLDDANPSSLSGFRAAGIEAVTAAFEDSSVVLSGSSSTSPIATSCGRVFFRRAGNGEKIAITEGSLTTFAQVRTDDCLQPTGAGTDTIVSDETIANPDGILTQVANVRSGVSLTTLDGARVGFSTAGRGMAIAISDDSIAKATKVLNNVELTSCVDSAHSPVAVSDTAVTEMAVLLPATNWTQTIDLSGDCIRDSCLTPPGESFKKLEYIKDLVGAKRKCRQGLNKSRRKCHVFGVHKTTIDVNSTNATSLRFHKDTGLPAYFLGDHVSSDGLGGANAMRHALSLCCGGTEVLCDRWFLNHSRWIIWKLASIERRFPNEAGGQHLSFQRLIDQLKYRYEKEVRCGMRSSVRKVLNKDVSSTTTMILCVSMIHATEEGSKASSSTHGRSQHTIIELTDGWYGVKAVVDGQMKAKLEKGIIQPGTKIVVCNAILIGAGDGVDPLDGSYDSMNPEIPIYMILSSNATRLAAWNSRLGFVKPTKECVANQGALKCRRLSDIVIGGGVVPSIDLLVCRVYPLLHFERNGLQSNCGLASVLTESEENVRRTDLEQRRIKAMEIAIESVDVKFFEVGPESVSFITTHGTANQ
jgi:breast cancer 2 susceptibility protein